MRARRRTSTEGESAFVKAAWGLIMLLIGVAVFGPFLSPYDPNLGDFQKLLQGPSGDHWLGTDSLGRDTLSRLIAGTRIAALAGLEATAVAIAVGVPIGITVGFVGGTIDRLVMRLVDAIAAIPALVFAIAIIAAIGSGLGQAMLAVGLAFSASVARLARGLALAERERLYVDGARVVGLGRPSLLGRHILPNIGGPLVVIATTVFAAAIVIEASLSFLGLGVRIPDASWGSMLTDAQRVHREHPWQSVAPGMAIFVTVLAINIVGDSLLRRRRGESFDHPAGHLEPVIVRRTDAVSSVGDGADVDTDTATEPVPAPGRVLTVRSLSVSYPETAAVVDADLHVDQGEVVALVGESGSGKTSLVMAVAGLLTPPADVRAAELSLSTPDGKLSLLDISRREQYRWRSNLGVVFQEPAASLNPLQTVGRQMADALRRGDSLSRREIADRTIELLTAVGLPRPDEVARLRPDQISGGMAQRVVIAQALASEPTLLVADEPTTALDVTIQAEIIALLKQLGAERGLAVILVTHDLGVAAQLADRTLVMYAGRVVEAAKMADLVGSPRHPYTAELLRSVPRNVGGVRIEPSIDRFATLALPTAGCLYAPRCDHAMEVCREIEPALRDAGGQLAACVRADDLELVGLGGNGEDRS
ncbi:MAG: dipeptide/oligopeptide/nickel ABC transporter permease/ATP-binding protein [Actinomycetota bacterium]